MDFTEQVAVVTGAARGIGEAIAQRIAALGAHVVLIARDRDRLEAVRAGIQTAGGRATAVPLDLRALDQLDALPQALAALGNRCDVLVNNAGVGHTGRPLHEMTPQKWDETMETNLRGPFLTIRAIAPLMIRQGSGHIINVSSLAGSNPLPNGAAYSASKWGLNGLTYSVAEELREHGIRVSVVAPGSVNTGFGGGGHEDERAARKLQPQDVADVVETLLRQPANSFISEVRMRPTSKR